MTKSLEQLLSQTSRVQDQDLATPPVVESMDVVWRAAQAEVGPSGAAAPRRSNVRRRIRAGVITAVLVGLGVSGGPAFADWVGLHTGTYDNGPWLRREPKSPDNELWRMNSPELVPHLRTWEQDYPLAPGYSLDPLIKNYAQRENTQMEAAGFRTDVFLYSECTWVDAWVSADRADDAEGKRRAAEGLAATVAKLDQPARIGLDENGRVFLADLVEAARQDNPVPLNREHRLNCDWNFR